MTRAIFLLFLAVIGLVVWVLKRLLGMAEPGSTPNDEIKRTVRKTSSWMESLKEEWEKAKNDGDSK